MKTLLQRLDECPPFLCYYGAHYQRNRRPTLNKLVSASGLSLRTFARIARKTSWSTVRVDRMQKFCDACGVDLMNSGPFLEWAAKELASGRPFEALDQCQGARATMLAHFNVLAAKAVLAKKG